MLKYKTQIISVHKAEVKDADTPRLTPEELLAFKDHTLSGPEISCIIWQGKRLYAGFGLFDAAEKMHFSHRIAWQEAWDCDIPEGYHIGHTCNNPPCVDPKHLKLLSEEQFQNEKVRTKPTWLRKGKSYVTQGDLNFLMRLGSSERSKRL